MKTRKVDTLGEQNARRPTNRALKRETRTAVSTSAAIGGPTQQDRGPGKKPPEHVLEILSRINFHMSDVEDYPGPTKNHGEKLGYDGKLAKADESMVTPPARPEEAGSGKDDLERQNTRRGTKRIISMKVVRVDSDFESKPCVILQCPEGEEIAPRATVTTRPLFPEQEAFVESADRVKILGKGELNIGLGDVVDVEII